MRLLRHAAPASLATVLTLLSVAPDSAARVAPAAPRPPAPAGTATPFAPTLVPSLSGSPVEGVILTEDSLAASLQPLADFHTRTGHPAVVRTLSTLRAADPRSNDLAQAIRSFLTKARTLWGTEWVLLAGDHEAIPLRTVEVLFSHKEEIPTDAYYADLDGTWDTNGNGIYGEVADSLDMEPDLSIGRLPVTNRAEAQAQVAKILGYRRAPPHGYGTSHLYLAEVLSPRDWSPGQLVQADAAPLAESLRVGEPACVGVTRLYENTTKYPGSSYLNRASALAEISKTYGLVQHIGHGSRSQISVGADLITLADITNGAIGDSGVAVWISSNCASAAVDFDCFAEALLRKAPGATVAYVGATRDAWPGPSQIVARSVAAHAVPKEGLGVPLGEAVNGARRALLPLAKGETQHRWGYFETILLGDPMLPVWRCEPRALDVVAPASVPLGASGFAVTVSSQGAPVESALVVAVREGEDYRAVRTDASGAAWVPFLPSSPGPFSLAVTIADAIPHEDSLLVTAASAAHFRFVSVGDDDAAHGDGDGRTDAGEAFGFAGSIENSGIAASSGAVTLDVEPVTPGLAVDVGSVLLASLAPGASLPIPAAIRLLAEAEPAVARAERVRLIARDAGRADTVEVVVAIVAPAPILAASAFDDAAGGNGNGVVEAGETVSWTWRVANAGSGAARSLVARARNAAAGVTILDSTAAIGDLAPGAAAAAGGPIRVAVSSPVSGALFEVRLEDARAHVWTTSVSRPALPAAPGGVRVLGSGTDRVSLGWTAVAAPRLLGYHVYRAPDDGSSPARVTQAPVRPTPAFEDEGLSLLTRYRYAVTAVDSSGNEGPPSAEIVASTTPPGVAGWPAQLGAATSSNVGLGDLDGDGRPELAVGADLLYVFRHDGTEVRDGDANPVTTGVFTSLLHGIASSPAMADLDLDGLPEIIAASWDDSLVAVFDAAGSLLPGWPRKGAAPFWSTPSIGDVDQDGQPDVVIGSNSSRLYAWRADGSEIRDGDANPATDGVLFVPIGSVISSPSVADLDHDGVPEIVFGTSGGRVYAMHADAVLPGWPVAASGLFSSSPAIGDVVPGGALEIVMASSNDSIYVFTAEGARAPGWPRFVELTPGNGRTNSPVIAPIRKHLGDPTLYVVIGSMEGAIAVFGPDGTPVPEFSGVSIGAATEASPGVADLDGDGSLEILLAGEDRRLHAFHHDGSAVSGFPIEIGAEARGTPAVWDLDGDGSTEIALAGWDRKVHVWSYPGNFSAPGAAWPMWRHDNWRTGVASFPILTSADPPPAPDPVPPPAPPARAYLAPNRPNPFNPSTLVGFGVPGPGPADVVLRVVDVSGRVVATLVSRRLDPGYHERRWDGRDDRGRDLGSGIYFLHARIGSATLTRKLALVR